MIEVRKFRLGEVHVLMKFIDQYWQAGHVLAVHRELLDWQHADGKSYAYLGAWDGDDLLAILGYIPTRRYDPALIGADGNVIWLALWKLRDDVKVAGLGLRLLAALNTVESNAAVGVIGINAAHLPMYRAMRFQAGELSQFVVFRRGAELGLALWPAGTPRPVPRAGRASLHELTLADTDTIDQALQIGERAAQLPCKSGRYFKSRYLQHPFYRYRVYALQMDDAYRGLLATRLAEHAGHRALRLVDWYGDGDAFAQIGSGIERLLDLADAEYADLWQWGMEVSQLVSGGFAPVPPDTCTVVPTLFEPFVQQNRRLQFAFRPREARSFVLMRADGDQDRPSMLALAG